MIKKRSKNLGFNLHKNKNNPYLYYTDSYFNSIKRIVRGALLATTRPVLCTAIINQCSVDEKEFFSKCNYCLSFTFTLNLNIFMLPILFKLFNTDITNNFLFCF